MKFLSGPLGLFRHLKWKQGSQINQYIMAILVTCPALTIGMILGWISPTLPLLQSKDGPLGEPISEYHLAWVASVTFLVAFPTMLVGGFIADNIGRKMTILIASATIAGCWLIKIVWLQSETIIFARALSGIGNAFAYVVAPIYVKEISDDNIRGALCSLLILAQNTGFVLMYVCGDLLPFNVVLWVSFLIPFVHFVIFLNAPETPSYLVKKGKVEEATEVLAWLRSEDVTDKRVIEDINTLVADEIVDNAEDDKPAYKILFTDYIVFKAFIICCVILVIQECCGYLVLLTYASEVFAHGDLGEALTPNEEAIVLGFVQLFGSIVACCLVERTGRKVLLVIMSFLTGVGMLALGTSFYVSHVGIKAPGWLPIFAMCLSIFCTAAGFQPLPYVILPELFSFKLRGLVSSISVSLTALCDFLQTETYESINTAIGPYGTFWMFSIVCFLGSVFTIFFIPETKDKSLEEIYKTMNRNKKDQNTIKLPAI